MKIAILVPFYKFLPADSCKSLIDLAMLLQSHKIAYSFISVSDTLIHDARERLFELFEQETASHGEYDFIMHIDSDQVFKVVDVVQLLKHAQENNFSILSGVYFSPKKGQVAPVFLNRLDAKKRNEIALQRGCKESEIKEEYTRMFRLPEEPFFEADVCGFGFLTCKPKVYADILAKFGRPVFAPELEKSGKRVKAEDVSWCEKAKECGYKVMADRNVIVGHKGAELGYREYKASLLLSDSAENSTKSQ